MSFTVAHHPPHPKKLAYGVLRSLPNHYYKVFETSSCFFFFFFYYVISPQMKSFHREWERRLPDIGSKYRAPRQVVGLFSALRLWPCAFPSFPKPYLSWEHPIKVGRGSPGCKKSALPGGQKGKPTPWAWLRTPSQAPLWLSLPFPPLPLLSPVQALSRTTGGGRGNAGQPPPKSSLGWLQ